MGESAPFWRFSASSYPDLEGEIPENTFVETRTKTLNSESDASVGVGISITFACNLFFFWLSRPGKYFLDVYMRVSSIKLVYSYFLC